MHEIIRIGSLPMSFQRHRNTRMISLSEVEQVDESTRDTLDADVVADVW